jgi:hypothetical protein
MIHQLNQNSELLKLPVDEIVSLIINKNKEHLIKLDLNQRSKCKDGFYLPYDKPQCRWVSNLLK